MSGVSEGLLAELQAKIGDGTERGMDWNTLAPLLVMVAGCVVPGVELDGHVITEEEVDLTNAALVAMINAADESAFDRIAIRETLATLVDYNEQRKRRAAGGDQ